MTHLILHKVRGEPQLDIAEQDHLGDWIIPTSGHAAFPMFVWKLDDIVPIDVKKAIFHCTHIPSWHDLRDHYYASHLLSQVRGKTPKQFTADDL